MLSLSRQLHTSFSCDPKRRRRLLLSVVGAWAWAACGEPTPAVVVYRLDQQPPQVQQVAMAAPPLLLHMRLTLSEPSLLYAAIDDGLFARQRSADHRFLIHLCDEAGSPISAYFVADFDFMQKVTPSMLVSVEGAYLQAGSTLLPNSGPMVHSLLLQTPGSLGLKTAGAAPL